MAYIGKVKVPAEWSSLESLIQAQIDGQSSFVFNSSKTYSLQTEEGTLRLCNASATPTLDVDGEHIDEKQFGVFKPDSGTLYARSNTKSGVCLVSVSEVA